MTFKAFDLDQAKLAASRVECVAVTPRGRSLATVRLVHISSMVHVTGDGQARGAAVLALLIVFQVHQHELAHSQCDCSCRLMSWPVFVHVGAMLQPPLPAMSRRVIPTSLSHAHSCLSKCIKSFGNGIWHCAVGCRRLRASTQRV
jgi:hypothetical protein